MPKSARSSRLAVFASAALACIALSSAVANAAPKICRQLEAQLAAPSGAGGGMTRKYDAAIDRQRDQLSIARGQARKLGCGVLLFGSGIRQCGALNATIARMEKNLDDLQRTRGRFAGKSGKGKSRKKLLAALEANGCREVASVRKRPAEKQAEAASGAQEKSPAYRILGLRVEPDEAGNGQRIRRILNPDADIGSYRTVCVRTCDGYYFPMSHASSRADFDRDQKNCEATCPGAEMQMFFQDNGLQPLDGEPLEDSQAMVSSVDGRSYSALETAYLYRKEGVARPASCGCNVARNFAIVAGNPPADTLAPAGSFVTPSAAMPAAETNAAIQEDRDSRLSRQPQSTAPETDAQRKVRVVGPVFLPDPAAAIDLQAPAQTQVR